MHFFQFETYQSFVLHKYEAHVQVWKVHLHRRCQAKCDLKSLPRICIWKLRQPKFFPISFSKKLGGFFKL